MGSYISQIKMNNRPKCMFCGSPLIAETVNITRNVNSYYTAGKTKPILAPNLNQEVQLNLRCPNCGSIGEGVGDQFQYTAKNSSHIIVISNVAILRQNGPEFGPSFQISDRKKLNPSRRDNGN